MPNSTRKERLKFLFCALLLLTSCARPREVTTVRVAVGGQTQFIYLPLTLADQLGYFKDEGLSVQISDLRGGSEALAALLGGSVDIKRVPTNAAGSVPPGTVPTAA